MQGATLVGSMDSPIEGADGNREFLLCLRRSSPIKQEPRGDATP